MKNKRRKSNDKTGNLKTYWSHAVKGICTWEDIKKLCDEAIEYNTASVCIPPSYIERIKETYGDKINICTVIGFPLGYNTTETKVFEVKMPLQRVAMKWIWLLISGT